MSTISETSPSSFSIASGPHLEAFFGPILDELPLVIFIKEAKDFRLVRMNRHYEELYGVSREDLLGKNNHDLLSKAEADYILAKDRAVVESGEPLDIPEERFDIPGRGEVWLHTRKVPLKDAQGIVRYVLGVAEDITAKKHAEEARKRELLWDETQRRLLEVIHELSTPVIPVHEGLLVIPLVGRMDAARGAQLTETLLRGVQHHRADMVLLDITGVPMIDAEVAGHIVQATRGAALLGATCVLVGASPEVARAMVELRIDLGGLLTQRDLQAGIRYALARQGKAIVAQESKTGRHHPGK